MNYRLPATGFACLSKSSGPGGAFQWLTPDETETTVELAVFSVVAWDADMYSASPEDVDIGDYTTKIEAEGSSGVETIEAVEKTLTIRVAAESSVTGTVVLVGILIVLVIGIAIASIKISRR